MKTLLASAVLLAGAGASAQQKPPIVRDVLFQEDARFPGHEVVVATVELQPGADEGRHTHAADLYAYVIEGAATVLVEGGPAETVKAGEVFHVPAGKVHQTKNAGGVKAKVAAFFLAEKGKPLATPVK
jgi:quercetin dioxygenase-like cupin family protein